MAYRLTLLLLMIAGTAAAEPSPPDPTRPPTAFSSPSAEPSVMDGPVLQSVMVPKKGRPVAVIGGRNVTLGEPFGDSRLVRVTEREAVLEGPSGTERLLLTPGIERKPAAAHNPANNPPRTATKTKKAAAKAPTRSEQ
ncbi:hypothetical protein [Propionivibrio limicola]|uniref:hypothetical protein n=1 Tax=Propionivibrio limicola TaxID=167645 RepID=UPI0012915790|nr:hypothetical protein [Propionivibrio limicola]